MMQKSQPVEIKLAGHKIRFKSGDADPEFVNQVVELVSSKIDEAEGRSKKAAPHYVTLLALMDLAAEYLQAKKKTTEYKKQITEKTQKLARLMESDLR